MALSNRPITNILWADTLLQEMAVKLYPQPDEVIGARCMQTV